MGKNLFLLKLSFFLLNFHFLNAANLTAAKNNKKFVGTFYVNTPYALLHELPDEYSTGIDTLTCNQAVKVFEVGDNPSESYFFVEVLGKSGLIKRQFLSDKTTNCIQNTNSQFFDSLNLDLDDRYYWGRLYDLMRIGVTKVK